RDAITAAFHALCEEIGAAAGLPLEASGAPRQIHAGFWYDDGAVDFGAEPDDPRAPIRAYCSSLGLPPPPHTAAAGPGLAPAPSDVLRRRARIFGALRRGELDEILPALRAEGRGGGVADRAAAWALPRLDRERLQREAQRSPVLAAVAIRRAAEGGVGPML